MRYARQIIGGIIIAAMAAGCGEMPAGDSAAPGSKKIIVWHWMTDRQDALQELAKRYEAKTGVKIVFELYAPSDAYSQKVRGAAQARALPDIFGILGKQRDFAAFIKAGYVANLTRAMEADNRAWEKRLLKKAVAINEFKAGNPYGVEPGIYGVPIDFMTIEMLYNKDLFSELGLDPDRPPATFQEFIEMGGALKAKNMPGLVSGWAEEWLIGCFALNYAFNIMGEDKVLATMRGDVPYTDPGWIKVFSLFSEMREAGVLAEGVVTMVNKTAEQLFANGKAVFAFNGSWCVNVYQGMNPALDYAVMLPPQASDKYPMGIWGNASSFMVNDRSKHKEEAVTFLQWLTRRDQQATLAQRTSNLPANKECLGEISPVLAQFADDVELITHPNLWGVSEFPLVTETFERGLQSIIIGEKSPEQVAAEVQKVKERELLKKRK